MYAGRDFIYSFISISGRRKEITELLIREQYIFWHSNAENRKLYKTLLYLKSRGKHKETSEKKNTYGSF